MGSVNNILIDSSDGAISIDDFDDPQKREIFRVWQERVTEGFTPSFDQLAAGLPTQLHVYLSTLSDAASLTLRNRRWLLEAQVDPGQDAFEPKPEDLIQNLLASMLKLRERRLRKRNAELRFLLEDAEKADVRVYQQATGETIGALSRLQRAMSSRSVSTDQSLSGEHQTV